MEYFFCSEVVWSRGFLLFRLRAGFAGRNISAGVGYTEWNIFVVPSKFFGVDYFCYLSIVKGYSVKRASGLQLYLKKRL